MTNQRSPVDPYSGMHPTSNRTNEIFVAIIQLEEVIDLMSRWPGFIKDYASGDLIGIADRLESARVYGCYEREDLFREIRQMREVAENPEARGSKQNLERALSKIRGVYDVEEYVENLED